MSLTVELNSLPATTEAALRADAEAQGRPVSEIVADALANYYGGGAETSGESSPEVSETQAALAAADEDERQGRLLTVEEAFHGPGGVYAAIEERRRELEKALKQARAAE